MLERLDSLLQKIKQIKEENKALKEEMKSLKKIEKTPSHKVNKKEKEETTPSLF